MELTTIPAAVARAAREFGDAPALAEPGGPRFSYRELHQRVTTVARALIAEGVAPGDRVAIWSPNTHHWVLGALGALHAGATLVPVSTRFTGHEALDVISRSGARALIVAGPFLGTDRLAALRAADDASTDPTAGPGLGRLSLIVQIPIEAGPGQRPRATGTLALGRAARSGRQRSRPAWPAERAARGESRRRQRHLVHLGHDRAEQGGDDGPPAVAGRRPGLGRVRVPVRRRPLPRGQPVLPQLRLQGRHPGLPGQRRRPGAAAGVRRGAGHGAGRGRADHRVPRAAHDLPDHPRSPGPRRPRPVQPAAGGHRRGDRPGRPGGADARGAELPVGAHRLRADRGGGGHHVPPGRRPADRGAHLGPGHGRLRGTDRRGRPRRGPAAVRASGRARRPARSCSAGRT